MKCLLTRMASVTIWSRLKLLFCLCLVLSSVFVTSSASAQSVGNPVSVNWVSITPSSGTCYKWQIDGFACGSDTTSLASITLRVNGYIADGLYLISFTFTVKASNTEAFMGFSSGENFLLIDQTLTQSGDQFHGSVLALTRVSGGVAAMQSSTKYNNNNAWSILFSRPSSAPLFDESGGSDLGGVTEYLQTISWNSTETQKKLETIISYLSTTNSHLSTISWNSTETQKKLESIIAALGTSNTVNSTTNNLLQDQLDEQKKQTEQQKEQYDQEKQEEADRENQGKDDMDQATGIFNFNFLNPFSGIFALFSPASSCASIPTLARWVHSDTSTVCSWWSADVRSVLTPVFGISSMILLFGFIVNWLRNAGTGGGVDIGWDSKWYSPHHGEKF